MCVYCLKHVVRTQILDYLFIRIFDVLKINFFLSPSLTNVIITIRVNGIAFSVTLVRVSHTTMASS